MRVWWWRHYRIYERALSFNMCHQFWYQLKAHVWLWLWALHCYQNQSLWVTLSGQMAIITRYFTLYIRLGANCVKVIQGRRFGTVRKPVCDFLLASNTYILSGTIPSYCGELLKLLLLTWVPLLNSGILGEPLNSEQQNLAQKTRNITLLCGAQHILIYWAI